MKRIRLWLRELSLTQQLLTIIFLFVSVFAVFLLLFLSPSIDAFSETEMFRVLHDSQESLLYTIEQDPEHLPTMIYDASITSAIIDPDTGTFTVVRGAGIEENIQEHIRSTTDFAGLTQQDFKYVESEGDSQEETVHLYSITKMRDGRFLVSIISSDYWNQFRRSLLNGVINMNILVVAVLFIFLMAWVGSLIIPLNQIKTYANKIKNDEPATLSIKRRDEIGEVAYALQEMEEELSKQNREKEEMIQNISHDLKTPIATIKSYGESIKDGIYPYDTLEKSVDVIIEHADRLEKKVHSLIILNKMGYLLDTCPEGDNLNMNHVIEKVLLSLKVLRPEISFIREMEPNVYFHGEEEPWRITVENLIDNALRYAKTTIRIRLRENELCVINDGKAISEERIDKLFRPYEKGSDGQFGLGLSIVYKVCTTYGYRVTAENLQEGVSFRIWKEGGRKRRRNSRGKKKKEKANNA